jgi:hypothetical protein
MIDAPAAGHRRGKPFQPGSSDWALNGDMIVGNWWTAAPSSTKQQIEPEQVRSAQEAVARGKAAPHGIGSAGILILAVLAIVYTLYFGKEILLPIALALVLKLEGVRGAPHLPQSAAEIGELSVPGGRFRIVPREKPLQATRCQSLPTTTVPGSHAIPDVAMQLIFGPPGPKTATAER